MAPLLSNLGSTVQEAGHTNRVVTAAAELLKQIPLILHAGDVGNHGGHREVLQRLAAATGAQVLAVAGNVDDKLDAEGHQLLPHHRLVAVAGWKLLLTHIVASGPQAKVDSAAAKLIDELQPDIVVFGHSHRAGCWCKDGVYYINPGSAGPARFKLPRTVARLRLPQRQPTSSIDWNAATLAQPNRPACRAASVTRATKSNADSASTAVVAAQCLNSEASGRLGVPQLQQLDQRAAAAAAAGGASSGPFSSTATISNITQENAAAAEAQLCADGTACRKQTAATEKGMKSTGSMWRTDVCSEQCGFQTAVGTHPQCQQTAAGQHHAAAALQQAPTRSSTASVSHTHTQNEASLDEQANHTRGNSTLDADVVNLESSTVSNMGLIQVEFFQLHARAPPRLAACK